MELGEKLKQARLEAGLSQRQLCGEEITRNMLSQIENGTAHPSVSTLQYLASQLGKPVSYFLEETALLSPNLSCLEAAQKACRHQCWEEALEMLRQFRKPDEVLEEEEKRLRFLCTCKAAEQAMADGKAPYAAVLLQQMTGQGMEDTTERQRLLLLAKTGQVSLEQVVSALPSLDEELLLRGECALEQGNLKRAEACLCAAEDHTSPYWNLLQGQVYEGRKEYAAAARCFLAAEAQYPRQVFPLLEICYREMGDYRMAYEYACKQR